MGQRLNVEIMKDDMVFATGYYHWSAYSDSALATIKPIVNGDFQFGENVLVIDAIRMLEATGAGLTEDKEKVAKTWFPNQQFNKCNGRNNGLIGVSEKGKNDTRYWEEGRVTIHADRRTFDFNVFSKYEKDEYEADYEDKNYEDFPMINIEFTDIPFERFDLFCEQIDQINDNGYWFRRPEDDYIYTTIQ